MDQQRKRLSGRTPQRYQTSLIIRADMLQGFAMNREDEKEHRNYDWIRWIY